LTLNFVTKPTRIRALEKAVTQIGVKEYPAGSNWGLQVSAYLRAAGVTFPAPWCAAFVTWCFKRVGYNTGVLYPASVESWVQWAPRVGYAVHRPLRGDVVCYDWGTDNWYDHIGFVEKVLALRWSAGRFVGLVRTVEGNTSVGNDSNGGQVMRRWRWIHRAQFVRIP
jgi:hypothetical protein